MGLTARRAALAAALAVAVATPASAIPVTTTDPYAGARSQPRTDSYYPGKGSPTVDALHYGLDLTWADDVQRLDATAELVFRAPRDESAIHLDLARFLHVTTVTLDGSAVAVDHTGNDLEVDTDPLQRNSTHTLVVRYAGSPHEVAAPVTRYDIPGVGWTTTRNGQVWTMQEPWGAYTWYPANDHPSDKAYYDITAHVRSDWRAVANGRLTADDVVAGVRTMTWHLGEPAASYLVTIAIGPYRAYADTGPGGLPLTYWVRDRDRDLLPRLRRSPRMIGWLEQRLGRYPFPSGGAVVVPAASAMETQTLVTVGAQVLRASYGPSDLMHEYSHQWYGDLVTPNDWRDLWLNESFAMYLEVRWEAAHGGPGLRKWRRTLVDDDQRLRDAYGPPGRYHRGSWGSLNVYYCGALMLDRLRSKIGSRLFERLVRTWPQRHPYGVVDRARWIAYLDHVTGRDLRHWVHRWLDADRSPVG